MQQREIDTGKIWQDSIPALKTSRKKNCSYQKLLPQRIKKSSAKKHTVSPDPKVLAFLNSLTLAAYLNNKLLFL